MDGSRTGRRCREAPTGFLARQYVFVLELQSHSRLFPWRSAIVCGKWNVRKTVGRTSGEGTFVFFCARIQLRKAGRYSAGREGSNTSVLAESAKYDSRPMSYVPGLGGCRCAIELPRGRGETTRYEASSPKSRVLSLDEVPGQLVAIRCSFDSDRFAGDVAAPKVTKTEASFSAKWTAGRGEVPHEEEATFGRAGWCGLKAGRAGHAGRQMSFSESGFPSKRVFIAGRSRTPVCSPVSTSRDVVQSIFPLTRWASTNTEAKNMLLTVATRHATESENRTAGVGACAGLSQPGTGRLKAKGRGQTKRAGALWLGEATTPPALRPTRQR